jgi:hypothetical protein
MRRFRLTPRRIAVVVAATLGFGTAAGFAATLTVGSWHLWGGSQTLTKTTCPTLSGTTQSTDTYVVQSTPNSSFGGNSTMLVKSPSGSQDWSFVRFDLSSCAIPTSGGADSATLSLYVQTAPGTSRTLTVTPVLSSWSGTLTWTTAQSLSYGTATNTIVTGTTTGAKTALVTVDVDALIKNPTANYGWRISDGGATTATTTFGTSENTTASHRPQLSINYEK